ncbi:MAG: hypothetical protein QOI28_794, partial [Mycobacterium sp.]|nr:hypothetical protein [Mycobacterium sp.]
MLLAVFAGIAMFGFWGIVIGPVLMIVVVTTISVYLAVYKGVPLDQFDDDDAPKKPGLLSRLLARAKRSAAANSPAAFKTEADSAALKPDSPPAALKPDSPPAALKPD